MLGVQTAMRVSDGAIHWLATQALGALLIGLLSTFNAFPHAPKWSDVWASVAVAFFLGAVLSLPALAAYLLVLLWLNRQQVAPHQAKTVLISAAAVGSALTLILVGGMAAPTLAGCYVVTTVVAGLWAYRRA